MSTRINHPLKSFVLFLLLGGVAWLSYEYIYVRRIFKSEPEVFVDEQERVLIRDAILDTLGKDTCFLEVGELIYRPKEGIYRIELRVGDGCAEESRKMCETVSWIVEDIASKRAAVWALDNAGNSIAHFVP